MNTAILITGQYRPQVKNAEKLIKNIVDIFKCEIFFHTWNDNVTKTPIEYHNRLVYCKEPEIDYHPISDIKWVGKHGKWKEYTEKKLLYNKTQNANKQIIAYADLLNKIPDHIDMCIRTRWDMNVSNEVDFKPWIERAQEGPVGFMTRGSRGHNIDRLVPLTEEAKLNEVDDWYGYLPDSLIIHKKEHFDSNLVNKLHADKNLAPAEWGFYQVMSEPYGDIHTSVHGGAQIAR